MQRAISPCPIRAVAVAFLAAVLCAVLAACSSGGQVAAKVGDATIDEEEVTSYTAQYREENGLTDDSAWAAYLAQQGLTTKTWREQAIGTLADKILVEEKAAELGISVDESRVDSQIAEEKEASGGEDSWLQQLSSRGLSEEEYRENLEFASLQQQVLSRELDLDDTVGDDVLQEYVKTNLMDRVLRRYSVIVFGAADKEQAQQVLDELKGLKGEALSERFSELASRYSTDEASASKGGDAGWNFGYSILDGDEYVTLDEGELYGKLLAINGGENGETTEYEILLCTKRLVFDSDTTYSSLDDEDLKGYIQQQALQGSWASVASEYLSSLRDAANVQVHEMPDGLPYDVDESE